MKKIISIILIGGFITIGLYIYRQNSACYNPISYAIGSVDSSFNISEDKFLQIIKEAENIWESGLNKDLFFYQPDGKLKINLIFDDRQRTTNEASRSKEKIETSRSSYDLMLSQYKILESSYKTKLNDYDYQTRQFEQMLQAYNNRVNELNSKGGATTSEYQQLQSEKQQLETLRMELNSTRTSLNSDASKLNLLGDQLNELAQKLNINVDIHNQRFGEAREFDQGDYVNNRINIYQYEKITDLRLVLIHELGHAIGLDHVENPESVMYYLMDQQNLNNPTLTTEDKAAFREFCEFRIPKLQEIFN